ncbi:MAG: UDP-N-acetylglucosamine--N-acetylmuramyl-(pentapeptide) pyrophosphoryl-undecaprenol N-acetylglucosamine transferase [candidate division WOR-3 bacterium]|nr:MAG: UDP-N-acetylglucosamine--N-acetylmuramyl-(pentapeptide) pyrophosphoryl-undecaprenol N-acetylglucosamine transferase [candidate division WOR-3 bacterium]
MKVLLAAGGTGGHVFPAQALADELVRRGVEVVWAGRADSLESRVAASLGLRFEPVPSAGFSGKSIGRKLGWLLVMTRGVVRSLRLLRLEAADCVVAAGGFTGAAPLLASRSMGIPFFLMEQNAIPGRVTRMFAADAEECYLAFPLATALTARCTVAGSPLRPGVVTEREHDGRTVLVLGGSGGARSLNLAALDVAKRLDAYRFIVLTGRRDFEMVKSHEVPENCEPVEFTEHPEELYRQATIAVSRAGGMVLSELVANGIPAILIPFPYATDSHQDANAAHVASLGAAITLGQDRLPDLGSVIQELMENKERREQMAKAALSAARPDAAASIAGAIVERIKGCSAA